MVHRRDFLRTAGGTSFAFAAGALAAAGPVKSAAKPVRIGLIADIHKDIVPDADERLKTFVDEMNTAKVDAVMQLGDFCVPKPANRDFLKIFDDFAGPRYHVIGNHDTDGGFKREQTLEFWKSPARYHSFDLGGFHFVILDANDRPAGWKSGYPHFIAADQVAWLEKDLTATQLPTFVFSHQSLERPKCIDNQVDVRKILTDAKRADGSEKVAGCFNGHWHIDHHRRIDGIPYCHINSASYFYMGGNYQDKTWRPSAELKPKFPRIGGAAPYANPLYTILEIDPVKSRFTLAASPGAWLGKSPTELGYSHDEYEPEVVRCDIAAVEESYSGVG